MRLFEIVMCCVCRDVWMSSHPEMLNTADTCRMMLFFTVMFWTTAQGAPPLWLRGVKMNAYPDCPAAQWFSIVFPSTTTFCAFLNSTRFLTVQFCVIQACGRLIRLRRIVMLLGTRFGMF